MSPIVKHIQNDQELPAKADVVVIGGGIIGATAAFFLAERGLSVALVEKGHVGCEQSSRNWGWCRQQNRDERELPLSGVALRLWGSLNPKSERTSVSADAVCFTLRTIRSNWRNGKHGARQRASSTSIRRC